MDAEASGDHVTRRRLMSAVLNALAAFIGAALAVPTVGYVLSSAFLARVARGGSEVGANTLTRFLSLHVLILPGVLLALIAIHLILVVRLGIAGISEEEEARKTGPWSYPEHLIKYTLMAFVPPGAAFALAMVYGAPP